MLTKSQRRGCSILALLFLLVASGCGQTSLATPTTTGPGEPGSVTEAHTPTPPPATTAPATPPVTPPTGVTATAAEGTPVVTPSAVSASGLATPTRSGGLTGNLLYIRQGNLYRLNDKSSAQLTSTRDLAWPRWSPDGQRIAVVRRGEAYSELHLIDANGQNLIQLTRHQSKFGLGSKEYVENSIWALWPSWEPSGRQLIYAADVKAANTSLYTIDVRGTQAPRQVPAVADLQAYLDSPIFSPDSKQLLFCLWLPDTPTQLWSINLATGLRAQLTDGKQTVYDPAWSPDGRLLAVSIIDGTSSSLWLLTPDGKQRMALVRRPAARAPTWSPDGQQLAFIGEEGGKFNIYLVDLTSDGNGGMTAGQPRRVTNDGDIDAPSGLSWAA